MTRWWTDHDTQRLIHLKEVKKATWTAISTALERSWKSCEQHYFYIRRRGPAKRSYCPEDVGARSFPRPRRTAGNVLPQQAPASPRAKAVASSSALAVDAELRGRIELVGITAGLFGDPLPGRSALDRKLARASP